MRAKPLLALAFLLATLLACRTQAAALVSAGTAVINTATFSYTDAFGAYAGQSNTLTIYVQNAPVMTITDPTGINMTPAYVGIDTFILTNAGNNAGTFALTGDATFGGTATGMTLKGYVINGLSSGTCSTGTLCTTFGALNAGIAALGTTAAAGTITVGVEYQVSVSATVGQTVQPSLTANIAYAAGTGTSAAASAAVTNVTYSDILIADARLDLQTSVSTPGSSGASITWTIKGNNGGSTTAYQSLTGANDISPNLSAGVLVVCGLPNYGGSVLGLTGTPTATLSGLNANVSTQLLYSTDGSNPSVWSTTYNASAKWLAVIVYYSGQNGLYAVLPSAPSQSSGAGSVTTAQITLSFSTNQPSGSGSGNSNAVTFIANSIVADAYGNLLAPGIAVGTQDTAVGTTEGTYDHAAEANTAPSGGTTPPGGASNQSVSSAYASYVVLNGPLKNAAATGSYPVGGGASGATNSLDFTAVGFDCANGNGVYGGGANCSVPANIQIPNTVWNSGNLADTITITATPPTGWTAQIFTATCAAPTTSVPVCSSLVSNSAVSAAGTAVSGTGTNLASGATQDYVVQYNDASNATPFTGVDALVVAAGTGGDTNNTHNDIYPGGVMSVVTTPTVTTSNCPVGVTVTTVCPGGTLKYVTTYANAAPAGSVVTNVGTEPSFAYAALKASAAGLTLVSDGTISNGWALNTFGLNGTGVTGSAVPAASDAGNTTVTAYLTGVVSTAWCTGTYPAISTGPNKLTALVAQASASVAPGGTGTLTYYVTVK